MDFYEDELDNENEQKEEQIIFMCSRCGFMYNLSNPPKIIFLLITMYQILTHQ